MSPRPQVASNICPGDVGAACARPAVRLHRLMQPPQVHLPACTTQEGMEPSTATINEEPMVLLGHLGAYLARTRSSNNRAHSLCQCPSQV